MIRIYADESDSVELVLQDRSVEVFPLPIRLGTPKPQRQAARRRSIGLVTAALLVGVAGGSGYLLAPRASPPSNLVVPPQPGSVQPGPATGPNAVARALDSPPSVTPPPVRESTTLPGVAAFGLQP